MTDTTTTTAKREALRNRPTAYELALIAPNGERFRLCYCRRLGRWSVWRIAVAAAERIATRVGGLPVDLRAKSTGKGRAAGLELLDRKDTPTGWTIQPTGRTERDALTCGELPGV